MNDTQLAEQIARDARLQAVRLGIDVDADLRDGRALAAVYAGFKRDAELALIEFADADIGDHRAIMNLQARVFRSVKTIRILDAIRHQAAIAEGDLMDEQGSEEPRED